MQVMVSTLEAAEKVAVFSPDARKVAEAFWPGALTLILPRRPDAPISPLAVKHTDTIGLRIPAAKHLLDFLKIYKRPIVATSANKSGQPAMDMAQIRAVWGGMFPELPLSQPLHPSRKASTVVRVGNSGEIEIMREGQISRDRKSVV